GGQLRVEAVEHDPGLDDAGACLRVHRHEPVAVRGPVDDHGGVGGLPAEAGAAAPRQDGDVVLPAHRQRLGPVVDGAGDHHGERYLPVVRAVGGVRAAGARVDTDLAVDPG